MSRRILPTLRHAWDVVGAVAVILTSLIAVPGSAQAADATRQPNVVVILADDLGYADVGFHGCKDIPTPHLDALAKRGVVCTSGYVSHPFCSPTRAGLLAGRYQQRFGHENNPRWEPKNESLGLPLSEFTIADAMKQAGYATGAVGKWHLGAHPAFHPNRRGFEHYFGLLGGGHQYFDHNQFRTNPAKAAQEYLIPLVRNETPVEEHEYLTDALGREAAAFVAAHRDKPFFLYLAFNAPHTPLQAPQEYLARVAGIEDDKRRTYAAMVCGMDDAIGRLMSSLAEHQLDHNTLVFFFSDNGGPVSVTNSSNAPLRGAKGQVYEGGIRVPFVISWPAMLEPGRFDPPVSSLDVFETAFAATGQARGWKVERDSINLLPHVRGDAPPSALADRALFWRTGGGASYALRHGHMKLVRVGSNPAELYDLATDIGESRNIAESRGEVVRTMQGRLDAWNATLVAPRWANPQPAKKRAPAQPSAAADKPNVIYIMSDELGYFEPGFMGGRTIRTPNLDRMAAEGIRFNNLFAGASVCAPTRACFLTGKHSGHTSVRLNGGGTPLRADEITIASMLKPLGYATGGFGKWGCGGRDSTGVPEKHGFDLFLGYYDQVHAHTYYPPYLVRNSAEVALEGNNGGSSGKTYSHYVIHDAALKFIRSSVAAGKPFFAYLPYTPPHGNFDIPDTDPAWAWYKDQPWPEPARRYAAMVSLVDRQVGEVLELLKELGIDDRTLVFFSGDNGGADYFTSPEHPRGIHSANRHPATGVEYRGRKGNLYEGGLRVPFIARWPGKISPGRVTDHLGYFPDLLPTIAEVTGATVPKDVDGLSLVPELIGESAAGRKQAEHEYLYWEFGGWTAIRQGHWRAVKPARATAWELYDLSADPGESKDVAAQQPQRLAQLVALAAAAHQPVREGTFSRSDRHERDRRAKFGKHDEPQADAKRGL